MGGPREWLSSLSSEVRGKRRRLPEGLAARVAPGNLWKEETAIAKEQRVRVNNQIRVPLVRLVNDEGEQVGIVSIDEALRVAGEAGLDLVEVAPGAEPPVCRVMDYGKFKYEQAKKAQEAKRKQSLTQLKEVKLRPKIEDHDLDTKMRNARRFLEERDRVKVTVQFRGREIAYTELGVRLLERVAKVLEDIAMVEGSPKLEGRLMHMILMPK
ncbi:MAG: translation initiation factor IF-3 [Deltaproteobacteria bacterium]|nr:translation initiation factor IF-3 [Deltaproteobacteria bacterium]